MKKVFALFMLTIATATVFADMPMKDKDAAACDTSKSCDTSKKSDKNDMNDDHMKHDQPK